MDVYEQYIYGDDADGNRGVLVKVFRCWECGYEEHWEEDAW